MISTYVSYQLLARDLSRTLAQTATDAQVAREAQYYRDNIGKVKSIDDLLNDNRLFAYAMKANGLDDMTYAKAFMRKVLESDLNDPKSFARKLVDTRYVTFAQSFNFSTDGKVKANLPYVQAEYQEDDTVSLYAEHRVRQGAATAAEAEYYQTKIGTITSVDQLLSDDRMFSFALTAYGIDARIASKSKIREALLSDLSNPASTANQLGPRYAALTSAFSFEADGTVADGGVAQSAAAARETVLLNYERSGNGASPAAAAASVAYYRDAMAGVTSVDDLLGNGRLFDFALTAFGLDPSLHPASFIREVLTSDLSDPDSVANSIPDGRYRALAAAFNFDTDGTVKGGGAAQSAGSIDSAIEGYFVHFDDKAEASDAAATAYYHARINTVVSVDKLLADQRLYAYVLGAFDLDPTTESKSKIKQILTSDLSNPFSFANRQSDPRYRELAAAFNFSADGSVGMPRVAQIDNAKLATIRLYNTRTGSTPADQTRAKEENTYYNDTIGNVRTVDDLVKDKRLVNYLVKAFDLGGKKITDDMLRKVLTSDPFDEKSYANKLANSGFRDLAAAFNFTSDGKIGQAPTLQVQTRGDVIRTADLYLRQTLEIRAGTENDGVRLALYFQRKAATIDSAYDILADKALYQVVRTALGLPDTIAAADVDAQARMLTKRLKLADFQDPKKVDKFLAQFGIFYDMNTQSGGTSPILSLIRGS